MKKLTAFLTAAMIFLGSCRVVAPRNAGNPSPPVTPKEDKPRIEKISLVAVGDVLMHDSLIRAGANSDGTYDYKPFFSDVKKYINSADLAIANMEGTLSGADRKYTGYPVFNCPDEVALALKDAGFDIITTANNHTLDRGAYGAKRTLDILDKYGLLHTGSYRTKEESQKILEFSAKGIRMALLNYTYGTNGNPIPKDMPYIVNIIDRQKMIADIQKARSLGVDLVIVASHLGNEYERQANQEQKQLYAELVKAGADIIIGGHSHVLQPIDYVTVNTETGSRSGLIFYSMGNFVSGQYLRYRDSSAIMQVNIEKNFKTNLTRITDINAIDTWVNSYPNGGKLLYRVLSVSQAISAYKDGTDPYLTGPNYQRLLEVQQENAELLNLNAVRDKLKQTGS